MPFEMLHDRTLDTGGAIQTPAAAQHRRALQRTVHPDSRRFGSRVGGSVLATYETSLYDEKGGNAERISDWPDMFGVSWRRPLTAPSPNSYLRVEEKRPPPIR